jgi:predicted nucleic acid-binding Zn ribbon protein
MGEIISESNCSVCGTSFAPKKGGKPQLYCTPKCRNVGKAREFRKQNPEYDKKYRKAPTVFQEKPCRQCGKQFKPLRNNHVFCSDACSELALSKKRQTAATCRECGARFTQDVKNQRYCLKCKAHQRTTRSANNEIKARLYKEVKRCKVCSEEFTAYRSTSLYCSRVCSGIASRRRVRDEKTLSVREVTCAYCGKTFMQKHAHQKFCSRSCSQMNWHYSENGQDKRFWTNYRLRFETVDEILKTQANACAICKATFDGARRSAVHVDHDHSCCPTVPTCGNCNRGLICGNCNTMLGMAKDNAEVLEKAADYLRTAKLPNPLDQ